MEVSKSVPQKKKKIKSVRLEMRQGCWIIDAVDEWKN
jgi:hypothetical protein